MKKVLIIAQGGLNRGGIQTVIMNYLRCLHNTYSFDIVVFSKDKRDYDEEFLSYGGQIFRMYYGGGSSRLGKQREKFLRFTKGYFYLKKILKDGGPYDVVHCHNGIESTFALKAAKKMNVPVRISQAHVIFDDHNNNYFFRVKNDFLKKIINKNATHQIGCSKLACDSSFFASYFIIKNPFDSIVFSQTDYDENSFSCPVLIQVGNISNLKNQLYSAKILYHIVKRYKDARLIFVGKAYGGYDLLLNDYIDSNSLKGNVEFHSATSNIPLLMSQACYLVQPSRTESFAIVLVEAQSMGLRCFASDVIPQEANAGGVRYLSIEDDPCIWANSIMHDFEQSGGCREHYDCSDYKAETISFEIDKIYNSK